MAEPIEMQFGMWTPLGPRKHVLDGGAHWRHLANTTKLLTCCGDAALCQNTSTICSVQLRSAEWQPDFGPAEFVPNWGATIVGARKFLIAYNVNLLATKEQAHRIALDIREQGRGPDQVHYQRRI